MTPRVGPASILARKVTATPLELIPGRGSGVTRNTLLFTLMRPEVLEMIRGETDKINPPHFFDFNIEKDTRDLTMISSPKSTQMTLGGLLWPTYPGVAEAIVGLCFGKRSEIKDYGTELRLKIRGCDTGLTETARAQRAMTRPIILGSTPAMKRMLELAGFEEKDEFECWGQGFGAAYAVSASGKYLLATWENAKIIRRLLESCTSASPQFLKDIHTGDHIKALLARNEKFPKSIFWQLRGPMQMGMLAVRDEEGHLGIDQARNKVAAIVLCGDKPERNFEMNQFRGW